MKYPTLDVYFHMRNHYRKLRFAKSTIDTSCPKGRSSNNHSHRSQSLSNDTEYTESLKSAHYPYHSLNLKRHECLHSHSQDDHNQHGRSHSTPCRPVTRRNPADMPSLKEKEPKANHELPIKQYVGTANNKVKKKDGKGDNGYLDSSRDKIASGRKTEKNQTSIQDNTAGVKKADYKTKDESKISSSTKDDELIVSHQDHLKSPKKSSCKNRDVCTQKREKSCTPSQEQPDVKKLSDSEKDSTISKRYNHNCDCIKNSTPNKYDSLSPRKDSSAFEHEYLEFSLRITEDIIRNDLYTNTEMRRVFNSHIEANRGRLNMDKMKQQIKELAVQLNIPYDDQLLVPSCHENANKVQENVRRMCECNQNQECKCGSVRCLPYSCVTPLNNIEERTGEVANRTDLSQNEIEIGNCKDDVKTDNTQNAVKSIPNTPKSHRKADILTPKKQDTSKPKLQNAAKKPKKLKSPNHNKSEVRSIKTDEDLECNPDSSKNEEIANCRTKEPPAGEQLQARVQSAHRPKKSSTSPSPHHARKKSKQSEIKSDEESIGAKESKGQQRKANSPNKHKKTTRGHSKHIPVVPVNSFANKCRSSQLDVCVGESCNFSVDVVIQSNETQHAGDTECNIANSIPCNEQTAIDDNNLLSTQCNFFDQNTSEIYTLFPCGMTPNMLETNQDDAERYFIVPSPKCVPKTVVNTGTCPCKSRTHPDDQVYTQMEEMGIVKLEKSCSCPSSKPLTHTDHQLYAHMTKMVSEQYTNVNFPPTELFYAPPKIQQHLVTTSCETCQTNIMTAEKEYVPRIAKRKVCKSSTCRRKNQESATMRDDLLLSKEYESGLPPSISKFFPSISTQTNSSDFIMIDKIFEANYLTSNAPVHQSVESHHSVHQVQVEADLLPPVAAERIKSEVVEVTPVPLILDDLAQPVTSHDVDDDETDHDHDEESLDNRRQSSEEITSDLHDIPDEPEDLDSKISSGGELRNYLEVNENNQKVKKSSLNGENNDDDDFMKKLDYKPKMSMTPSMEKGIKKVQHDSEVFRRPEERRISWGGEAGIDISVGVTTVVEDEEVEQDEDEDNLMDESIDIPIESAKKKLHDGEPSVTKVEDTRYFDPDLDHKKN